MNNIIVASTKQNIVLGYEGENVVTQIIFVYDDSWLTYGDGEFKIRVLRNGDKYAYNAELVKDDRENRTLTMTVTDTELAVKGNGEMQLCYFVGEAIKKSCIYSFKVLRSIDTGLIETPPTNELLEEIITNYILTHTNLLKISENGKKGQLLVSNGDGTYSWMDKEDYIPSGDDDEYGINELSGSHVSVPFDDVEKIARAIKALCDIDDGLTLSEMLFVLENTKLYTLEDAIDIIPYSCRKVSEDEIANMDELQSYFNLCNVATLEELQNYFELNIFDGYMIATIQELLNYINL